MVALGWANSRMEGFYGIWILSRPFPFEGDRLARAITATFAWRGMEIPTELPDALSPAFAADEQKQRQWRIFVDDVALDPGALADVLKGLGIFLMTHATSARRIAGQEEE